MPKKAAKYGWWTPLNEAQPDTATENKRLREVNTQLLNVLQEVRRRIIIPPTADGEAIWSQINEAIAKATKGEK